MSNVVTWNKAKQFFVEINAAKNNQLINYLINHSIN